MLPQFGMVRVETIGPVCLLSEINNVSRTVWVLLHPQATYDVTTYPLSPILIILKTTMLQGTTSAAKHIVVLTFQARRTVPILAGLGNLGFFATQEMDTTALRCLF